MNVVLFAWCTTAAAYVDALADEGAVPSLVVTGPCASAAAPLSRVCRERGIPLLPSRDPNGPELVGRLREQEPDLLLVCGCAHVLGQPLLSMFRIGGVNFHPSLLPWYRGRAPLFWALLRGETEVGITVHHLTQAVDAGPILLQKRVPVPPHATSASLAAAVDRVGSTLVPELFAMARTGALPDGRIPVQAGSYFPPLTEQHGAIDFTRSAAEIQRLVRASLGEIYAFCTFDGMKLVVLDAALGPAVDAAPGEVHAVTGDGIVVGARDGSITVRRWLFLDRPHGAEELASRLGIVRGSRLEVPG